MKVKAAVVRAHDEPPRIEGHDLAEPAAGELLVRMVACGVARADLAAISGRLAMPVPFVPGSEGAGVVEKVGDGVSDFSPGDAVLLGPGCCGNCEPCRAGRTFACERFHALNLSGRRRDGAEAFEGPSRDINGAFFGQSSFATHAICDACHAQRLDPDAPLEILAALGHEFIRGASVVLDGFQLQAGDTLVVLGADAIGLAATVLAKAQGAKFVLVADPDERRRERASAVGADVTTHGIAHVPELFESIEADGADFALDTIGDDASRAACLESVVRGGICAFVAPPPGIGAADQRPEGAPLMIAVDACRTQGTLSRLLALYRDGSLPLERMSDFFPFEHVADAIASLRRGDVAKPVLRFAIGAFDELDRANTEGAAQDVEIDDVEPVAEPDEAPQAERPPVAVVRS